MVNLHRNSDKPAARVRPGDSSKSTQAVVFGFQWCSGCSGGTSAGNFSQTGVITASARDDHVPSGSPEDQLQPTVAIDPSSNDVLLYWYDTEESYSPGISGFHNFVTSLHGAVEAYRSTTPGNQKLFAPSPPYVFGAGTGFYDLGEYAGAVAVDNPINEFACGVTDGEDPGTNAASQNLGFWTTLASP